jgi:hypothetical protein
MGVGNYSAGGVLAENTGKSGNTEKTAVHQVGKHVAGTDGWELIRITDQYDGTTVWYGGKK